MIKGIDKAFYGRYTLVCKVKRLYNWLFQVNSMAKDLNFAFLLETYSPVLTDNQRSMLEMYYYEDLSLAEIADNCGISRQGVRDAIKRGETALTELEDKLGFARRQLMIDRAIYRIRQCAKEIVLMNNKFSYISELEISANDILSVLDTLEE